MENDLEDNTPNNISMDKGFKNKGDPDDNKENKGHDNDNDSTPNNDDKASEVSGDVIFVMMSLIRFA
jgi:hypothetical protein